MPVTKNDKLLSDEEKNKPCVLDEYDKDTGFEKGVVVVHEDGTTTLISEEEYQRRCSGMMA